MTYTSLQAVGSSLPQHKSSKHRLAELSRQGSKTAGTLVETLQKRRPDTSPNPLRLWPILSCPSQENCKTSRKEHLEDKELSTHSAALGGSGRNRLQITPAEVEAKQAVQAQ